MKGQYYNESQRYECQCEKFYGFCLEQALLEILCKLTGTGWTENNTNQEM